MRAQEMAVIAEVKRSSPSKGALATIADPAALAEQYQEAGACAISVLTERRRFSGSLADLDAVRKRVTLPILRKDFMVDEYQFFEARAHGADLVLLIVAGLSDSQLNEFAALTRELGMRALVEVHTNKELERALEINPDLVGINSRNLKTLEVDPKAFAELLPQIPSELIRVAESGISQRSDVEFAQKFGANAILVGEALVKAGDPNLAMRELLGQR
jgi:indole-3-glycerol phosphate synthase